MKHFFISLLIGLSVFSFCNAQDNLNISNLDEFGNYINRKVSVNVNKSLFIEGSPYINDTFELIKFKRFGDVIFLGRYNANLGEMQIRRDNDTIVLNNSENFEITFVSDKKVYKTYSYTQKDGSSTRGFLVVLKETDSMAVLKEEKIKFQEKKPSTNGYDKAKPAKYVRSKDLYYYRLGNKVSLLPQKRKEFLKLYPEHSNKLKEFIKQNKINLKEADDLITLFGYIEKLIF
ncbi:hypothetical protein [Winogradskyella schleiferi]|uniref:hypothetical protein n=1 Tax=Winogradskyella schleiferi TaxID=2686078 RepID=UPI0015BA7E24|nr:hypothetical protein [Winogradskyella schleiferi]